MKTEEFKNKVSKGLMGHKGYGIGIPRTEEVKQKIRESLKGRPKRKHTEASKVKMSKNNSGKGNPNSKIYIIDKDNETLNFETKIELKNYLETYNIENNLTGPNRVSIDGILNKGISKNFKLIEIKKLKQV